MRKFLLLFLVGFVFVQCKEKKSTPVETTDKTEIVDPKKAEVPNIKFVDVSFAKGLIATNKELKIIDVRTPEETAKGMLDGAIVINVKGDDFDEKIGQLNKEETYLVYCRSGKRSKIAVNKMHEQGFKKVYMMNGGYLAWTETQ